MAAFLQCEQCGRRAEIETGFLRLPEGWIETRERTSTKTLEQQFCGWPCVCDYSAGLAAARREAEAEKALARGGR